jgi:hypothetical protein
VEWIHGVLAERIRDSSDSIDDRSRAIDDDDRGSSQSDQATRKSSARYLHGFIANGEAKSPTSVEKFAE